MPRLFTSDFFLRFTGGFALGAVAVFGTQALSLVQGALAHVV